MVHHQILLTIPHIALHHLAPKIVSNSILSSLTYALCTLLELNHLCGRIHHVILTCPYVYTAVSTNMDNASSFLMS